MLKKKLRKEGIRDATVVKTNSLTYYVKKCEYEGWLESDIKILESCFYKIRKGAEKDLIIPRDVEVECIVFPIHAWIEEYFRLSQKS